MLKELIKLSNTLDELGLVGEANSIDSIIEKLYSQDSDNSPDLDYNEGHSVEVVTSDTMFDSTEDEFLIENFTTYLESVEEDDVPYLVEAVTSYLKEESLSAFIDQIVELSLER